MLHSWRDGAAKSAIVDFVARTTRDGGPDFVPPSERIATFDNDGTLWCEQPLQVQLYFGRERLEALATRDPSIRERQPFKAYLERDLPTMHALGRKGLFEVGATVHAGMTEDEFDRLARDWLKSARHPQLQRRCTELVYQPQLELLSFLRSNGFRTFIVSGGGIDLMRAFAEEVYGIPPEQVIGSSVKTRFELQDGVGQLVKLAELNSFDDREVKPQNIQLHIGRRPILAFGNSDGDLAMLRYVKTGPGARLALLLHHDDAGREFAYDRDFSLSPLADALDNASAYGITVVSMKRDWSTVLRAGVTMTLQQAIGLAIQLSMALIVFAVALRSPRRDIVHLLREPGLLLRSLLAMNVLMPLVAVAIALAFDLNPAVEVALVAMSLAPVPPIVPGKEMKAGGPQSYVLRLLAAAALLSIVFVPAMTALLGHMFGRPVHIGVGTVAKIVVTSVLLPLLLGYGLRHLAPAFAARIAAPLSSAATALLLIAVVPVLFRIWPALVAQANHGSVVAIVAFVLIGLAVGHVLGGPDPDNRTVLALSTSTRHPAVAMAVMHNDPTADAAMAAVLLVLLIGAAVSVPYVKWRSRTHVEQHPCQRKTGR